MGYDDFCRCTPEEFSAICKAWQSDSREDWERMRLLAAITIQPHIRGKADPKRILPLPWDADKPKEASPKLTAEERKKRFEELAKKFSDGGQRHDQHNIQA